jgi:hypothetical protein
MEENIKIINLRVKHLIGDIAYHRAMGHAVVITGYTYDGILMYCAGETLYYECELTKTDPNLINNY